MSISPHPHPSFSPRTPTIHRRTRPGYFLSKRANQQTPHCRWYQGGRPLVWGPEMPSWQNAHGRATGSRKKIAGAEGVGRETAKGDLDPHRFQEAHEKRTMLWMGRRRGANQRPPTQLFAAQGDALLCSRTAANVLPFSLPKRWWDCWQLFLPEQALWPCPCVRLTLILIPPQHNRRSR